jgi:glycosyltransferase involved in cell wall biosynthesis
MNHEMPFISVVVPCYNEVAFIERIVDSLLRQDYPREKTEVIFADGMSDDGTREALEKVSAKYPFIRWIDNPGRYVPTALNLAIKASGGKVIVRLDAHSDYPDNYLSTLLQAMMTRDVDNVGGVWNTLPGADTDEARAIVLASSHPLGIGDASYRLGTATERFVDTVPFGCFKRELFDRIGFFDEDLIRNQDDEFNGRIIRSGGKILLLPNLRIGYYARPTRKKLSVMFYQYGLFKPLVNLKLGAPATLRQFVPPVFVSGLFLLAMLSVFWSYALWLLAAVTALYLLSIVIVSCRLAGFGNLNLLAATMLTFPVIHFSYGIGYIFGLYRYVLMKSHLRGRAVHVNTSR